MVTRGALLLSLIFAGAGIATFIDVKTSQAANDERYTDLQLFSKVLNLVQQYYVDPVDII